MFTFKLIGPVDSESKSQLAPKKKRETKFIFGW